MKYIKVLGALMLLLISSNSFSFSIPETGLNFTDQEQHVSSELEKKSDLNYDGNLSVQVNFLKIKYFTNYFPSFRYYSCHKERIAKKYFDYSNQIDPSLGVSDIIFPFHSFL